MIHKPCTSYQLKHSTLFITVCSALRMTSPVIEVSDTTATQGVLGMSLQTTEAIATCKQSSLRGHIKHAMIQPHPDTPKSIYRHNTHWKTVSVIVGGVMIIGMIFSFLSKQVFAYKCTWLGKALSVEQTSIGYIQQHLFKRMSDQQQRGESLAGGGGGGGGGGLNSVFV